jgi:hypothetical protein
MKPPLDGRFIWSFEIASTLSDFPGGKIFIRHTVAFAGYVQEFWIELEGIEQALLAAIPGRPNHGSVCNAIVLSPVVDLPASASSYRSAGFVVSIRPWLSASGL